MTTKDESENLQDHLTKRINPNGWRVISNQTRQPEDTGPSSNLDTSQCPDCHGSGFYYPKGIEGGVARCKHEQLSKEGEEGYPSVR